MVDATDVLARDEVPVDNFAENDANNGHRINGHDIVEIELESVDGDDETYGGVLDVKQNERGVKVNLDRSRDENLTAFGKATLTDRYLMPGESFQDLFARLQEWQHP